MARVYSRLFLLRKWFVDDTLILASWIFSTAVCVAYSLAAETPNLGDAVLVSGAGEAGQSTFSAEAHDAAHPYIMYTYLALIFYQMCLCLTKLSILAFYLRMFSSGSIERILAGATVVVVLLYGAPLLFLSIFQCHPSPGLFFGRAAKCFLFVPLLIASASLHTVTDAWLIIMIIPCVARLSLPPRQKAALAVVLSLSIFVIAASMTRLQLSLHANYRPSGAGVRVSNTLAFFIMTVLECDIALMCATAPTLRPMVAYLWPRWGMGENHPPEGEGGLGQGDGSGNLTMVSYHGYPWTEPNTTAAGGSKNGSAGTFERLVNRNNESQPANASKSILASPADMEMAMPTPPTPAFMNRTPTTLSLRSFMSSITTKSRTATTPGRGDDREGLLRDEEERNNGDEGAGDGLSKRGSSVGFEGYHDQYLGYGEEKKSRTTLKSKSSSRRSGLGDGLWGDSQESFVLGMNDPASPKRLSPVPGTEYPSITEPEAAKTAGNTPDEKSGGTNLDGS